MNSSQIKRRFIYFSLFIILFSMTLIFAIGQYRKYQLMHFAEENSKSISFYLSENLKEQGDVASFHGKFNRIEGKVNSLLDSFNTVRFKVWNLDGVVLQSDKKNLIGKKYPKGENFYKAANGKTIGEYSTLKKEENIYERQTNKVLIEVYSPLILDGKQIAVVEYYFDVSSVESFLIKNEIYLKGVIIFLMLFTLALIFRLTNLAKKEVDQSEKEMNIAKEKVSLLLNTTIQITSSLTIEEILTSITTSVVKYGQIQSVSVYFLDQTCEKYYLRKHSSIHTELEKKKTLSSAISQEFQVHPNGFRIESLKKYSLLESDLTMLYSDASAFVCPIRWNDILYGVVFYEAERKRLFTEEEISIYTGISNQLGVALRNAELFCDVSNQATKDGLTQLFNFRYFNEKLPLMLNEGLLNSSNISLILLDIDHFKLINDTYGHQTGDEILIQVAKILKQSVREIDIVARYGGEEFVIILDQCPVEKSFIIAERIRKSIRDYNFCSKYSPFNRQVTLSAGIATFPDHAFDNTSLIERADKALYVAKKSGRNKVVVYDGAFIPRLNQASS